MRRGHLAIAAAALAAGLVSCAVGLTSDRVDSPLAWAIAGPTVGWLFIGTGLYAWQRRPDNRTGLLMVLLGFAWLNSTLANANPQILHQYAGVTGGLWGAFFLHLGIGFPTGRVRPGLDRALVIAGYVIFPLGFLPGRVVGAVLYGGLFALVLVRSARYWRAAGDFERLQLTPVYTFALLTFALVTIAQSADYRGAQWAAFVSSALMPFAFIVGLTRSRISKLDTELRDRMQELRASRARLVAAGDAARRKLERDLHDGAQSRLVALALTLRAARNRTQQPEVAALLDQAQQELQTSLAELRELARGIHPAVLTEHGLTAAVEALVGRAPVPVTVETDGADRLPAPVESAAYFVVSEGLANVAKYARAGHATVTLRCEDGRLTVEVADDGVGGATLDRGSGLRGLADRVAALDGTLAVTSPAGEGTCLRAEIPV
ncbi:MAG TPA: histidine kinase [Solirubrobacter sp.]|nr:histidine kinase [Solirubrobacter sp.]